MRTGAGALARMRACGSEAEEHMCACRVRGHTCVCVCCVRSAGKVSGGRRAVRPVPHAGPALRSAGRTLAGVWRGRPCARGDAGRLAGRVAVRVVPRGLVLGREGACVGVRRVPSGARGGVAAEQVARGRAVVFEFIGVPGGFWRQSGRKKPKKISFFSFFFLSLFRGQATNRENNNMGAKSGSLYYYKFHNN